MGAATFEANTSTRRRYLVWRVAVPPEKGGWVWWLGPLGVGALAAPELRPELLLVVLGGFCAFSLRQPLTLALKQLRRGKGDFAPVLFWAGMYSVVLALVGAALLGMGYGGVVVLGLLGVPIFGWHLTLVYFGKERHQHLLDLAAAAALALTGPAAYLSCGGTNTQLALWIFVLSALQSCASVIHMFLRLEQRALRAMPPLRLRLRKGLLPVACHLSALAAAMLATHAGVASLLAVAAMSIPLVEGTGSVLHPPVRATPKEVGVRQLVLSVACLLLQGISFVPA